MSLNGLEATEVTEAYQSALGEGGGWFLLKYKSRDEVGLLGRGSGGLGEVQEAVHAYEEQSPLFGFIQYRRRKVVLKYVPEGTSRLLQARVSVQFQSVTERITPYDTIFSFSKPSELQDSALYSACSLHTATASIKSANDPLSQRNLAGITEEARVEDQKERRGAVDFERGNLLRHDSEDSQTRYENSTGISSAAPILSRSTSVNTQRNPQRPRTTSNIDKALPPTPGDIEPQKSQESAPRSVLDYGDYETRPSVEGRISSQSGRPSPRDLYDAHGYKKKVKYGPRPSIDSIGRPDNMDRTNEFRPVSTLPAGLRMPARKSVPPAQPKSEHIRPHSRQTQHTIPESLSSEETLRASPPPPVQIPDRNIPAVNNGPLTPAKSLAETRSPKMTPEKRKLMKALQLRQKQLAAQQPPKDPPIEEAKYEPETIKSDIDKSILNAIVHTSNPELDCNIVHVAVKDLSKEESRNLEASPISLPETSDGPSTQASSITDGEDIAALKEQGNNMEGQPAPFGNDSISSYNIEEDTKPQFVKPHGSGASLEKREVKNLIIPSINNTKCTTKTNEPAQPASREVHEALLEENLPIGAEHNSEAGGAQEAVADLSMAHGTAPPTDNSGKTSSRVAPDDFKDTSQNAANFLGLPEEQGFSKVSTGGQSPVSENEPASASKVMPLQDIDMRVKESSRKQQEASNNTPDNVSALSNQLLVPESDAAANHSNADDQLEALRDRRALSHQAVSTSGDHVLPQELPLPPIDEDEEASLNIQGASLQAHPIPHQPAIENKRQSLELQAPDTAFLNTQEPVFDTGSGQQADRQTRRHVVAHSPKRVSSPEHSDEHFLSDESFMEELKSATVQEAKPISVSRSPIKPAFSRSESESRLVDTPRASRSVSSPFSQPSKDEEVFSLPRLPTSSSSRSFSASQSLRPDYQQAPMPKKIGVSSGISQRIKALEQLSSRPTSPQSGAPSNASQFITLRKISVRTPPGTSDHINNNHSKGRSTNGYHSPSSSPETANPNAFTSLAKAHSSRPESISVTATIVRDAGTGSTETPMISSESRALELHHSALVVEHQKMAPPPLSPLKPPRPRYGRYSSTRSGSTSSTEQKLEAGPAVRRDSFASMRSRSSRASEVELPPRSLSDTSLVSGLSSLDDIKEEKKDSKRSRLLKRMSSGLNISRRSIAHALSPSPKEAPIIERQEPTAEPPSTAVDVGDVNVQFPDTLLWKRRHMVVDEQGFLVLSASKSDNNSKVTTKKFPLSEFRTPYVPDQDRQELPNSVVLDLKDGSTLQCACEHLQGQASVLQILRHAHSFQQSQ